MFSFKQFMSESGDFHYPFKVAQKSEDMTHYHFPTDDQHIMQVSIEKDPDNRHLSHVTFHDSEDKRIHYKYDLTGKHGSNSHKIMSTIHHIIRHHVGEHPGVRQVGFESSKSEPSRAALYKRYTAKMGGETESDPHYEYQRHLIPAKSFRK